MESHGLCGSAHLCCLGCAKAKALHSTPYKVGFNGLGLASNRLTGHKQKYFTEMIAEQCNCQQMLAARPS
eukprot:4656122-Amphidinium_carterae.1